MIQDNASFTFLHRIEEVELNIEDGRWQSALALVLTLPDICGGIAFPEIVKRYRDGRAVLDRNQRPTRDVGNQYIRWFDTYAAPFFKVSAQDISPYICGERCWQLRCEYLHQNKGFANTEDNSSIRFHLGVNCGTSVCQLDRIGSDNSLTDIRIDIEQFCRRMCQAARGTERFGVETKLTEVLSLELSGSVKKAVTSEGAMYAKSIVLATGAGPRELGVDGEQALIGKGVHYCAACDGMFYRNKTVVIAGGGNTAAADALILSRICKKVIVVHRRGTLKATKIYHEPLMKTENVEFVWDSEIIALLHNEKLTGIQIRNVKTGEESTLACDGVFVSVGRKPSTELMKDQIEIDPAGYIIADESTRTNIPGVFAVGDVRTKALRQVVTAVADGATAAHYAEEYLAGEM